MLPFIAGRDGYLRVHDRAALGAVADRSVSTQMVPVLAQGGLAARQACGWIHELALTATFGDGREWSAIKNVARGTGTI